MIFTPKMSGIRVDDYDIIPLFNTNYISLSIVMETVTRQETMNWILNNIRFNLVSEGNWKASIDDDTIMKLSILENYPGYEKEMINHIGENWLNHYIRFSH